METLDTIRATLTDEQAEEILLLAIRLSQLREHTVFNDPDGCMRRMVRLAYDISQIIIQSHENTNE